jgi:hypothetical protein
LKGRIAIFVLFVEGLAGLLEVSDDKVEDFLEAEFGCNVLE